MMDLLNLDFVVSEFNERAMLFDQAFAAGADNQKLQSLYNSLQSSNWDYERVYAGVLKQLWAALVSRQVCKSVVLAVGRGRGPCPRRSIGGQGQGWRVLPAQERH